MRSECFEIVDHTADVGIKALSRSIEGLFYNLFLGWKELSFVLQTDNFPVVSEKLYLEAPEIDDLLVMFLSEINYLLVVKGLCCIDIKELQIVKCGADFKIECSLQLIQYDSTLVNLRHEIKAITYSNLSIVYEGGMYSTTIILDL